ncbi:hypothetical protein C7Y71_008590 [Pseudoprevotella muciniphila]|uniref:Uncharacterized protein n=1 Tax=Pseudoprevotella muciniphila TaxID=2133944 RepID=A0A5P8E3K4_9BACT|nr:hypothetical protein [Pseudoprevotella muciniphila]QFQ11569.1 hypothetical protein C7Y71_000150 [Pseudoprevotella muciniphila]QFQ13072.1 hypothetical protein C7Y71_008590 [Pseudoprevotella muciniphila]
METDLSQILNWLLGGSLVGALISIVTIRSALKKARAEAERAIAESDTVKITNTEQATRILIQNIVEPLKQELNETRKELSSLKREVARFRKAVDSANSCRYSDDCPVLERMRDTPKERSSVKPRASVCNASHGQRDSPVDRQRKRACGDPDGTCDCSDVVGDADDSDGQPP